MKKTLEQKKKELQDTLEMLEKGVKEVFESDKFREYLDTMSKFHNYSPKNILWIQMQKPDATKIAGMKAWNKLGRKVIKGQKSLKVLAPFKHKKEVEMDKLNPKTGKPILDKGGKAVKEKQTLEWISYRAVPVFDISQTDGKELPRLVEELQGNVNDYEYMKDSLIEVAKIPVEFENIQGGSKGYYHLTENRIAIKEGMSEKQTIKTMMHEVTHSRLHSIDSQKNIKDITGRNVKEIEAESTAYVVSKHFGIDTSDYSFGYVASWSEDKELKELEASLKTIQKEANGIISEVEEKLEEKLSRDREEVKEKEIEELQENKEVKEPYVEIIFSEVEDKVYFSEGEKIPFNEADLRFKEAEKEVRDKKEDAKEKGEYYPYLKTRFNLKINENSEKYMRYDIGDRYSDDLKEFCEKELDKDSLKLLNKALNGEKTEQKQQQNENKKEFELER